MEHSYIFEVSVVSEDVDFKEFLQKVFLGQQCEWDYRWSGDCRYELKVQSEMPIDTSHVLTLLTNQEYVKEAKLSDTDDEGV